MPASLNFWEGLFPTGQSNPNVRVEARLLKKRGRPFLLLPLQPRAAALSLALYPAQTLGARLVKAVLRGLLRASIAPGTARLSFATQRDDPFVQFLAAQAGEGEAEMPMLGVLAGNPASDGQRFLLLVFDANQKPVAVVKAGLSERAQDLIAREESVLVKIGGKAKGVPPLRGSFQCPRLRALALDYFPGDSPGRHQGNAIASLLSSWVDPTRTVALAQMQDWLRLERAGPAGDPILEVARRTRDRLVHSAIQHGDFAPWNIKVTPAGDWRVLDWERGEVAGIPGWDWFHYVIQPAILVDREPALGLVPRVESLLASAAFKEYAVLAGFNGCERELVLAYLQHAVTVIKPSEGLAATRELLAALATRWTGAARLNG